MSLRTALLAVQDSVTTAVLASPAIDVCPYQLTVRTRTWLGGYIDAPVVSGPQFTDSDLALPKKLFVRPLSAREVDSSGGRFAMGDIEISGITPNDPANGSGEGFSSSQMTPHVAAQGTEIIYLLTGLGPLAAEYGLAEMRTSDPFETKLILSRRNTTPSVT